MEHTKKMMLVPPEFFNRMNEPKQMVQPTISANSQSMITQMPYTKSPMNDLDSEMNHILNKTNLDDREKWSQYYQILQRYFHQNKIQRQPVQLDIEETAIIPSTIPVNEIIEAYPASIQKNAERLLNWIKRSNTNITWDDQGTVRINGITLNGSNITDIIGDLVRYRKTAISPTGIDTFMEALRVMNIPDELIGNRTRARQMRRGRIVNGNGNGNGYEPAKKMRFDLYSPSTSQTPDFNPATNHRERVEYLKSLKRNRRIKGGWEPYSSEDSS